jgi:hypothetical protein
MARTARFSHLLAVAAALAVSASASRADTVVERHPACADREQITEVMRLTASEQKPEADTLFAAGVRANTCRFVEIGEIVAVLAADGLVRLLSFTAGDRLWTRRDAIARCESQPDWLPAPRQGLLAETLSRARAPDDAIRACHPKVTKWRSIQDPPRDVAEVADDEDE